MLACALELGDVVVDRVEPHVLPVDPERHEHHLHVNEGSVLSRPACDPLRATCLERLARHVAPFFTEVSSENEVVDRATDRLFPRVAEELGGGRVPVRHPLLGVHDDNGDGADLYERREVLLLTIELRGCLDLRGDVDHETLEMGRGALLVANDPGLVADTDHLPVCCADAVLERPAFVTGVEVGDRASESLLPILGKEHRFEEAFLEPCVGRVAEDLLHPRADVDGDATRGAGRIWPVRVHDEGQLLDEAPVPPLGCALCLEEARVLDRDADVRRDRGEQSRVSLAETPFVSCALDADHADRAVADDDRHAEIRAGTCSYAGRRELVELLGSVEDERLPGVEDSPTQPLAVLERRLVPSLAGFAVIGKVDPPSCFVEQRHVDDVGVERLAHPLADELDQGLDIQLRRKGLRNAVHSRELGDALPRLLLGAPSLGLNGLELRQPPPRRGELGREIGAAARHGGSILGAEPVVQAGPRDRRVVKNRSRGVHMPQAMTSARHGPDRG